MGLWHPSHFLLLAITLCVYSTVHSDQPIRQRNLNENTNRVRRTRRGIQNTILEIPQGTLEGMKMTSLNKREIFAFLGIPYGQPPTGDLRFNSPVAAGPWSGTLDATNDNKMCPQLSGDEVIGDEDCLHLNVYAPQISTDESTDLLPVMVFVHGGGFEKGNAGASQFSPQYLLDKDVLLVAPNYRLGVLGFLSTGDDVIPGNYGLKDIVLALKWVQNNIAHFGGDAKRVTVFGHGTGAGAVELLALSTKTNGLFHRYITESGSALSIRSFRPRESYAPRATELGGYLNCPTDSSSGLVECLRQATASSIVNTKSSFYVWDTFPDTVWGPTEEPDGEQALITKKPDSLYATADMQDLPWITGVVQDEGLLLTSKFYANSELFETFLTKFDDVLPHVLQYHNVVKDEKAFTAALKAYYFNDLTADRGVLLSNFTKLVGDAMFVFPAYSGLRQRLGYAKSLEYFYNFRYRGSYSFSYNFSGGSMENYGIAHGDELMYLFPQPQQTLAELGDKMSENDKQMTDNMVQLWTSFAIGGKPSGQKVQGFRRWRPHSIEDNYLQIGDKGKVTCRTHYFFLSDRMRFWKEFNETMSIEPGLFSKFYSFVDNLVIFGQNIVTKIYHLLVFW